MFFYLISNSNLFNKSVSEQDKYIKLLIYGTITYVILHAILFVGGPDALFYNFRYYFWIILALDVCVFFVTNIGNEGSLINKLFTSDRDEIKNEYRVDIQNASINDIMTGAEQEQINRNNNNSNAGVEISQNRKSEDQVRKRKKKREKKTEKKVTFDFTGGQSDYNKFAQQVSNPNQINTDSILNKNQNKSTPLDSLFRERATNPNDFVSGLDDGDGYQSFSDSESEYNSDLDMDMFEKGLTM